MFGPNATTVCNAEVLPDDPLVSSSCIGHIRVFPTVPSPFAAELRSIATIERTTFSLVEKAGANRSWILSSTYIPLLDEHRRKEIRPKLYPFLTSIQTQSERQLPLIPSELSMAARLFYLGILNTTSHRRTGSILDYRSLHSLE